MKRFGQSYLPYREIRKWFGGALKRSERGPPDETLDRLARQSRPVAPEPTVKARGRPVAPWRRPGREFAELVAAAMRRAGYEGRLRITDPESVTVAVATRAIRWAYRSRLKTSGFVTAMRIRDRRKKTAHKGKGP